MIAVALVIFCCGLWAAMQCANHAFGSKGAGTALGIGCMLVPVGVLAAGLVVVGVGSGSADAHSSHRPHRNPTLAGPEIRCSQSTLPICAPHCKA